MANLDKLKLAIKDWEYEFKRKNGRQAGKEDIKEHAEIAAEYKEYHYLKRRGSEKKEHKHQPEIRTPKRAKRKIEVATPDRNGQYDLPYTGNSASSRDSARSQRKRIVIGPTPQTDGKVLGLFDISPDIMLLPPSPSPSQRNVLVTPTKQNRDVQTPKKNSEEQQMTPKSGTLSYFRPVHSNRIFMTPSPLKPRKVVRGLSSILAELKRIQDDEINEEENIMRGMEMDMVPFKAIRNNTMVLPTESVTNEKEVIKNDTQVDGTQIDQDEDFDGVDILDEYHLGEVQEGDAKKLIEESKKREAIKSRVDYKKAKTQKRSTRRVKSMTTFKAVFNITNSFILVRPSSIRNSTGVDREESEIQFTIKDDDDDQSSDDASGSDSVSVTDVDEESEVKKTTGVDCPSIGPTLIRAKGSAKVNKLAGGVSNNFKRLKIRSRGGNRRFRGMRRKH
ncbi:DNA replication/checkpoint protein [Lipomyces arxii]|uniref:DNA replication/checkpoint protein n=1 Tax=Lipomyces arxii TaxID=56418 RepID=UPI0034CFA4AA